jgi:hypothetical protein
MRELLIVMILLVSFASHAQSGKYLTLSEQDATKAKQLDDAVVAAIKAQTEFRDSIRLKYTIIDKCPEGQSCNWVNIGINTLNGYTACLCPEGKFCTKCPEDKPKFYRPGWNGDFEYSEDYKLIFPKPETKASVNNFNGCITPAWTGTNASQPITFNYKKDLQDKIIPIGSDYYGLTSQQIFWLLSTMIQAGKPIPLDPADIDWLANAIWEKHVEINQFSPKQFEDVHKDIRLHTRDEQQ